MKTILWLVAGLGLTTPALAADAAQGFFDIGYVPSSVLKLSDSSMGSIESDGGAGIGLRVRYPIAPGYYLAGEYQRDSYDGFEGTALDTTVDALRAGIGFRAPEMPLYVQAEFIREKFDFGAPLNLGESESGYAVHAGAQGNVTSTVTVFADAGYVDVGDFGDGFEFLAGGAFAISPRFGIFADYRRTQQEDQGSKITISDFRGGLRVFFGD